jgi:hypothetical protein
MRINFTIDDTVESVTMHRPIEIYSFAPGEVTQLWEIIQFKDGQWNHSQEWRATTFEAVGMAAIKAEAGASLKTMQAAGNA